MPRISAGSVEEHREQVHQRVLAAFAELLAEHSFDAITMAQLAAAAGIGRTAIYHHFADREAVVVAFASYETDRYLEGLRADLADVDGPVARLRVYLHHHLAAGQQFHMGQFQLGAGQLSRDSVLEIRDHVVVVEDVLRGILTEGVDAGLWVMDDPDATVSLVHACLTPRHLPTPAIESFVLRALSRRDAR